MSVNSKMTAIADQIRTLQGGTGKLGLDAMAAQVGAANSTVTAQATLISQIATALEGKAGGGAPEKPAITFDGRWTGWYLIFYHGIAYWEAMFYNSGILSSPRTYACDVWGIGGGGAGGRFYSGGTLYGTGGGSGFTNMMENLEIPVGRSPVTIGAGASVMPDPIPTQFVGATGGDTSFLGVICAGGKGGDGNTMTGGLGGSNGGGANGEDGGENGSPGAGFPMTKFRSGELIEYGAKGTGLKASHYNAGGGGGYLDIGAIGSRSGHGYGGGGGGGEVATDTAADWKGRAGCLAIRIPLSSV